MPLFPDKILELLVMPLGMAVGAGLLALLGFAAGWRRCGTGLLAFGTVWLWVWSTPLVNNALARHSGHGYPDRRMEALPVTDAIVLLGGGSMTERVWRAASLHEAGKAPLVIASGGPVCAGCRSEADVLRNALVAFGVPAEDIGLENRSLNTRQNAVFTARLAAEQGIERVLLVTSVWHMPRAEAVFRRVGLEVVPAAIGGSEPMGSVRGLALILPYADALYYSTLVLREHVGLAVYRLRGWA